MIFSFCPKESNNVFRSLRHFIRQCPKVISMDAYMTDTALRWITGLRTDQSSRVILNVGSGLRYTSNSKEWLQTVVVAMVKQFWGGGGDDVEECKLLLMVAGDTVKPPVEWTNFNVVAYSPVIVAGLDCQNPNDHFHHVFAHFTNGSCTAAQAAQMCMRLRKARSNRMELYIRNTRDTSAEWYPSGIVKYLMDYNNDVGNGIIDFNNWTETYEQDDAYMLTTDYLKRKMQSQNDYAGRLKYYLEKQRIVVVIVESDDFNFDHTEFDELKKKEKEALLLSHCTDLRTATSISLDEYTRLMNIKNSIGLSHEQKLQIAAYKISQFSESRLDELPDYVLLPLYESLSLISFENEIERHKAAANAGPLRMVFLLKPHLENQVRLWKCMENDNTKLINKYKRDYYIKKLLGYLCLTDVCGIGYDDLNTVVELDIENELGSRYRSFMQSNAKHMHTVLKVKKRDLALIQEGQTANTQQGLIRSINSKIKFVNRHLKSKQTRNVVGGVIGVRTRTSYTLITYIEHVVQCKYKRLPSDLRKQYKTYENQRQPF
eukprot:936098_1